MIKLTLQIATLLFYLEGLLLISFEIIFGKIYLINLFANEISYGSNKYKKELSRFILTRGIISEEKIIAKIGVFLTILAIFLSIFLLMLGLFGDELSISSIGCG